jgi:hypothetical protein
MKYIGYRRTRPKLGKKNPCKAKNIPASKIAPFSLRISNSNPVHGYYLLIDSYGRASSIYPDMPNFLVKSGAKFLGPFPSMRKAQHEAAMMNKNIGRIKIEGKPKTSLDAAFDSIKNPYTGRLVKIYNHVDAIFASKAGMDHKCDSACKKSGHRYQHKFKEKACIYGLSDGTLLIK